MQPSSSPKKPRDLNKHQREQTALTLGAFQLLRRKEVEGNGQRQQRQKFYTADGVKADAQQQKKRFLGLL